MKLYQVSIDWQDKGNVKHIERGNKPVKPNNESLNESYFDVVMYSKQNGRMTQIAIESNEQPFLVKPSGQTLPLFQVEKNLWIIKGEWMNGYNRSYHKCPSINTSGEITIVTEYKKAVIDIHLPIDDFDFEDLKNDFEAQLWELITYNDSPVATKKKELRYGNKIYTLPQSQLIISFIQQFKAIARKPKEELIQTIEHLPSHRVKPINATLKYATKFGIASKTLPSKAYTRSFDNYENRYLCFMLRQVDRLVQANSKFAHNKLQTLEKELEYLALEIEELNNPSPLDSSVLWAEIETYQKVVDLELAEWKKISETIASKTHEAKGTVRINISYNDYHNADYKWGYVNNDFSFFKIPDNLLNLNSIELDTDYELIGNLVVSTKTRSTNSGNTYSIKFINNVSSIKPTKSESILNRKKDNYRSLEANNFKQILNLQQRGERDNQVQTLAKRQKQIKNQVIELENIRNELSSVIPRLLELQKHPFLKSVNQNRQVVYKPSMIYLQNPEYRKAYELFAKLLNQSGINIEVFEQYEQTVKYGIRDMPQVYELWTLVKLIKALEDFGFKPKQSDYKRLLKAVSPKSRTLNKSVEIIYQQQLQGRKITLYYQATLKNGKRPDMLLKIQHGIRTIYIVLDAKFKNYNYKKSAIKEAQEMKSKYGLNSDYYVFTLHPCKGLTIVDNKTVRLTNLGGDYIHNEDGSKTYLDYEYGYVMLKPNQTHNLKKLLGLSLEYLLDHNHNAKSGDIIDPRPDFSMICIECGSKDFEYEAKRKKRLGKKEKYFYPECFCKDCGHQAHLDYCWNCKTKLFKHGRYWDYHKTSLWSSFDIHCPSCGMTVADRPS